MAGEVRGVPELALGGHHESGARHGHGAGRLQGAHGAREGGLGGLLHAQHGARGDHGGDGGHVARLVLGGGGVEVLRPETHPRSVHVRLHIAFAPSRRARCAPASYNRSADDRLVGFHTPRLATSCPLAPTRIVSTSCRATRRSPISASPTSANLRQPPDTWGGGLLHLPRSGRSAPPAVHAGRCYPRLAKGKDEGRRGSLTVGRE